MRLQIPCTHGLNQPPLLYTLLPKHISYIFFVYMLVATI